MPLDGTNLEEWQTTLLKAAEIVRERWRQNGFGKHGYPRCGIGAVFEATGFKNRANGIYPNDAPAIVDEIQDRLSAAVGCHFPQWNDMPGRTAEEVASVMESVALQQGRA